MQRAIVIGCPGAGKSTFARKLRARTGLPLYYLDMLWHRPDRTNVSRQAFDAALSAILATDRWIIDGNYLRTLEMRLQARNAVFFLDYPLPLCLAGAQERIGTKREDMPWVETEFDPEFKQWIEEFPKTQLPDIRELLGRYAHKEIHTFHSRREADAWLAARFPQPGFPETK